MRKIKKAMVLSMALAMGLSLVACGSSEDNKDSETTATTTENGGSSDDASSDNASSDDADATADLETGEGSVYNVYVWNTEFQSRVETYYPGYTVVDSTTGKVGNITVNWIATPSDDNAYQNALDEALKAQADASADEKIDMFLVEADYALKYVDTDYAMSMSDIGITDDDLSKQYQYTKDVMTDSNGVLKGVSWQGCPGVMFFNREIAKEVLGSDDLDTVQAAVATWDDFNATAAKMKEAGYSMTSAAADMYRVFSNNVTSKWVDADYNITIDDNIKAWVDLSKEMIDAGETTSAELWSDQWKTGFYQTGGVFCYFGPMWEVNFSMSADDASSVAGSGGFGAVAGPQGFFWGGTWICAAAGSDNTKLTADIIKKLCTDDDIMKQIALDCDEFVNNKDVIAEIAADDTIGAATLGGQNPYAMLDEGASKIDLSNLSAYDQGCNETFQNAMTEYFNGTLSYDEAVEKFLKDIKITYPELDQ